MVRCFCKYGYILDKENGNCIPEDQCPSDVPSVITSEGIHLLHIVHSSIICDIIYKYVVCGDNFEWNDCGSACPPKCSDSGSTICSLQCVAGCFCKSGYKLDNEGNCIPEDECQTITTTTNEVCPLRCESGFDGCNYCLCDGLGNIGDCTERACIFGTISPSACKTCEVGYALNIVTNECESGMFNNFFFFICTLHIHNKLIFV